MPPSPTSANRDADLLQRALAGKAFLLFDGAMGTMLQEAGLRPGELPELLCLTDPDVVEGVHRAYAEAGCDVATANTFGANAHKLAGAASVAEVFAAAVGCARRSGARYVAADIGPSGMLLEPLGTLSFDEAYRLFAEQARAAQDAGADLVVVETMGDLLEAKAAVLACRECSSLPVFTTMTFGEDGRTFLGTGPEEAAMTLDALGVDALGVNCSQGPDALAPLVARMARFARVPLMVQANAGLPRVEGEATVYDVGPDAYARAAQALLDAGATVLGGCCGTTPGHMRLLRAALDARPSPGPRGRAARPFAVCSARRSLVLDPRGHDVAVIGERINPTGKPRLKEALRTGDYDHLVAEALGQEELGADVLDVNVGLPELDEPRVLAEAVSAIQAVCDLPLQLDSTDPAAIERAARRYAGKPLVNSVNGTRESLDAILPVCARYGCAVVGLTLDEGGIPPTAPERLAVARRIVEEAERAGIPREDVAIDCLAMAASTNQRQVSEILRAIALVKEELGVRTVLGVSNISFGLPQRELLNAVFLASAFGAGLDLAIVNPRSQRMRDVVAAHRVLCAQDEGGRAFIEGYAGRENPYDAAKHSRFGLPLDLDASGKISPSTQASPSCSSAPSPSSDPGVPAVGSGAEAGRGEGPEERVRHLVLAGRKGPMPDAVRTLLADRDPLEVIDGTLIPALDEVGARFERGELFLPQLMASAEAVKAGFDTVRAASPAAAAADKGDIVLATVKGDIHDIGKNIVRMLLENYGYRVHDLGRDVEPQAVVDHVLANNIRLVGLSALMTTTVRAMEETIALLHEQAPACKVMVGGAVLNPEYARMVGADFYGKDAAESARIAGECFGRDATAATGKE